MTDEMWARQKTAAREYSSYRPRRVVARVVQPINDVDIVAPDHTIGVAYCDYGEQLDLLEFETAPEGTLGWTFDSGVLRFTEMTTETTVLVVWKVQHIGDELTKTFPTIPLGDIQLIEWLAEADEADEAQAAVDLGVASYTIGNTTVKWAGGATSSNSVPRGALLRQRAISMLQEPIADWG